MVVSAQKTASGLQRWLKAGFFVVALLMVAAAIWLFGPLVVIAGVYPFESILARFALMLGLFAFAAGLWWMARRGYHGRAVVFAGFAALGAGVGLQVFEVDPRGLVASLVLAGILGLFLGPVRPLTKSVYFGCVIAACGALGLVGFQRMFQANAEIWAVQTALADYRQGSADIPKSPIEDTDFIQVIPALSSLREAALISEISADAENLFRHGDLLELAGRQAYRDGLNSHLLPRLILRMEHLLSADERDPDHVFEMLKVYLMLGLQGPMDRDLILDWFSVDWGRQFPRPAQAAMRAELESHLDSLLSQPMQQIPLDRNMVLSAQQTLAETPFPERIYRGIVIDPDIRSLPGWSIEQVGGPDTSRVFSRASGKPLNEMHSGLFTPQGFHNAFVPLANNAVHEMTQQRWVLGEFAESEVIARDRAGVTDDVYSLYYADYIEFYERVLDDLIIVGTNDAFDFVELVGAFAGPRSPVRRILNDFARATALTDPVDDASDLDPVGGVGGLGRLTVIEALKKHAASTSTPLGQEVQVHFDDLRNLTQTDDNLPSRLDDVLENLWIAYRSGQVAANARVFAEGSSAWVYFQRFQAGAKQIGGPLERWAGQLGKGAMVSLGQKP